MSLINLPNEVLSLVCHFLDDEVCINSLHQTCRRLHSSLGPALYRHNARSITPSSLEWAAKHGVEATALYALDAGISPTTACFEEWVPIALACMHGHEPIVRLMLEKGIDTNLDNRCWTNFEAGRYCSRKGEHAISLMSFAALGGHLSVCKTLLEYGTVFPPSSTVTWWVGDKAILLAGREGHFSVVKFLLEMSRDSNGYEDATKASLNYAAYAGDLENVRYFLNMGVEMDMRTTHNKNSPLESASRENHLEVVKLLLSTCDVTNSTTQRCILFAIGAAPEKPHKAVCDFLREKLNAEDLIGSGRKRTREILFSIGAMCNWVDLLQLSLNKGCSPDINIDTGTLHEKFRGWTALTIASKRGYLGAVELLLDHEADINKAATDKARRPPIVLAAENGHIRIVEKLLRHGADPNPEIKSGKDKKRLFAYRNVQSPEIMNLLLDWGADAGLDFCYQKFAPFEMPYGYNPHLPLLPGTVYCGSVAMLKMLLARKLPLELHHVKPVMCKKVLQDPHLKSQVEHAARQVTHFALATENSASMVEFILEQGYKVEPGSSEVRKGFDLALRRADIKLVDLFLDRDLLGDLIQNPPANLLGSIMSDGDNFEAAAIIMDRLLAHGFRIKDPDDLSFVRARALGCSLGDSKYYEEAISQMLLDRGANPIAGSGLETELSIAAGCGEMRIVQIMLKSLKKGREPLEDLLQKLTFAKEEAEQIGYLDIARALQRAYWRAIYPVPG